MTSPHVARSVDEWLEFGIEALTCVAVETPRLDARLLLATALDCDASRLLMREQSHLATDQAKLYEGYIKRRALGEPVSRILGRREFWSLQFTLSSETLDPRPDSETVVETALSLKASENHNTLSVLDLGTGSGCLLLSLLKEWPSAEGVGTDISFGALETARLNARALGMESRATFLASDWLGAVAGSFDVIVSNPPYIREGQLSELQTEVCAYDPNRALDGGLDGLAAYRRIVCDLGRMLSRDGIVILEIGYDQEQDVRSILMAAGLTRIESHRDLGGHVRCISAAPA